jgi:hypothetical protein
MGVYDVNGDGLTDIITALAAHGYGLAWHEQLAEKDADGSPKWLSHVFMHKDGLLRWGKRSGCKRSKLAASEISGCHRTPPFRFGSRRSRAVSQYPENGLSIEATGRPRKAHTRREVLLRNTCRDQSRGRNWNRSSWTVGGAKDTQSPAADAPSSSA